MKCKCGCERNLEPYNKWGYKREYIHGHNPTKHTEKYKKQLSKRQSGDNNVAKRPNVRKSISNTLKKKWKTGEIKLNSGNFKKGHKLRVGMKHTSEGRNNISKALKGRKVWNEGLKGYKSGSENANWKGGITPLNEKIRALDEYKNWRTAVFERDNFTCQKCGKKGKNLEAHHKISFIELLRKYKIKNINDAYNCKELWNINNGITYCILCHSEVDKYRRRLIKK
ncbi:MAG: hypothetical protein AABY22_18270 [Nanoarchaeota archaeon]|mgnify:CR=1 FL=1